MSTAGKKQVLLAAPRGYCAGVDRAVVTVEKALDLYGKPVYVRKQIVHNKYVVQTC
jgi:4-hydroxy-3-methylbut-2-enyl diphosphate reductase